MASSSVSQEEQDTILSPNSFRNTQKTRLRGSARTRSSNNPPITEAAAEAGPEPSLLSGSLPEKSSGMSGEFWRNNVRDKRSRQPPTSGIPASCPTVRNKLRDRRRLREKRRSPGANYIPSTEGTSTGDEEGEVFASGNKEMKSPMFQVGNEDSKQPLHHQHFHNHANSGVRNQDHPGVSRRLSPGTGLTNAKFRGSKSQSDLDADCEDNTADYDSASMISASETGAGQSQFFIPDPSVADRDFQAHVQEIRVAGMQQLTASGGPQSEDDQATGTSSDDMEEDLGKILEKERREKSTLLQQMGQQEDRIVHLERMVNELTRRLQDTCLENQNLRAENISLQQQK